MLQEWSLVHICTFWHDHPHHYYSYRILHHHHCWNRLLNRRQQRNMNRSWTYIYICNPTTAVFILSLRIGLAENCCVSTTMFFSSFSSSHEIDIFGSFYNLNKIALVKRNIVMYNYLIKQNVYCRNNACVGY
jgi:hypothetical protein